MMPISDLTFCGRSVAKVVGTVNPPSVLFAVRSFVVRAFEVS